MHKVALVRKANTPQAAALAEELGDWLGRRGVEAQVADSGRSVPATGPAPTPSIPPDADLVVVLGGDGTMLAAARGVVEAGLGRVPILGVNLGGLGFLTALSPEELTPVMERTLAGDFSAPARMMLQATVLREAPSPTMPQAGDDEKEAAPPSFYALNDVVINKAALARIVELRAKVGQSPLTTFRADGLIVSTPTGSTAYNLSAGGPICHPDLECLVVAPICSFALSNRPLILGPQLQLEVGLGERTGETTLTCDGQVGFELLPLDRVLIQRAPVAVRIVESPFRDYFEILRTKLRWG